jgi:hypothetical protein
MKSIFIVFRFMLYNKTPKTSPSSSDLHLSLWQKINVDRLKSTGKILRTSFYFVVVGVRSIEICGQIFPDRTFY